jgi:L-alanine-DL-glutamate epimerase-like enolase superfamily enzyme
MKITNVTATLLASKYDVPIHFAHMELTERFICLVRIYTDQGIVGIGDIDGSPAGDNAVVQLVENTFAPLLIGTDPLDIGARNRDMFAVLNTLGRFRSLESYVLGGLDIALWDILGKASGQSISRLLGRQRDRVETYASLGRVALNDLPDVVKETAGSGFRGVKIRIGFPDADDEALVAAARNALGKNSPTRLMADVNSGWNAAQAVQRGRRLEKYDLYWLEEPLPPYDLPGSAALAKALDVPVALGEHEIFNRWDARAYLEAGAVDILQPDLRQGISETMKIAHLASAWDVSCMPHFFGPAIRFAAMLQVLGSIDNYLMCEYPIAHDPIRFQLTEPAMVADNGIVLIPDGPGLGITLNEDIVERYRVH